MGRKRFKNLKDLDYLLDFKIRLDPVDDRDLIAILDKQPCLAKFIKRALVKYIADFDTNTSTDNMTQNSLPAEKNELEDDIILKDSFDANTSSDDANEDLEEDYELEQFDNPFLNSLFKIPKNK